MTGDDVVTQARTWLGTPWAHEQILKGVGVDCAGLIIGVARELGIVASDFDVPAYRRTPDGSMIELCRQHMIEVSLSDMQTGDVCVVAVEHDPQHMGFICEYRHGGFSLIHAALKSDGTGRVIETRLVFARNLQFVGVYRLPGIA